MDESGIDKKDYNFIIFSIYFELYLYGKKIEKSFDEPMVLEEYYFINLEWLKNLKTKFNFEKFENLLNFNFSFDHTFKLEQNDEDNKFIRIFQQLKNKHNYQFNVTEDDFNSIKIIDNGDIERTEKNFVAQKNFALVGPRFIECLTKYNFIINPYPKYDVYNGNKNLIFENPSKHYNYCLECIIYNDYDSFKNEYVINFEDKISLNDHKNFIISKNLDYYFDEVKIKPNEYIEQFIYDNQNQKIGTVYNLNSEKLKAQQKQLNQSMKKFYNFNENKYKFASQRNFMNDMNRNIILKNSKIKNININNSSMPVNINKLNLDYSQGHNSDIKTIKISQNTQIKKSVFLQNFIMSDKGLKNFGNSCYINAVLQCLIHIRQIIIHFLNPEKFQINEKTRLSRAFYNLLIHFYPKNDFSNFDI
jgi:hypothetical protein